MGVNIYSEIGIMRLDISVKTGGSYSSYLAYGTFEMDKFGDEVFTRKGYISTQDKSPKGVVVERKSEGSYGSASHYYHYIVEVEEDFKYFILEVGSGKQTTGSKKIIFTPLCDRKESAQVEALENLLEQTAPIDSETIASLKNSLNLPDAIAPELLEAQKLVDDPEAIQRGYLLPEMPEMAKAVIAEAIAKSLPLTGDIGSPDDFWLANCEAYQQAAASFSGRKFGTFLRLVNAYKDAMPSTANKSISDTVEVAIAPEVSPVAEQLELAAELPQVDRREWIDPTNIDIDKGTQTRAESAEKIADYAEMMRNDLWDWTRSDIVIYEDENGAYPSDGHHRIMAAIVAGVEIFAEVKSGSLRDAIFQSFASNKFHGLPLSREDKNNRVKAILLDKEWQLMSDRAIADHCGVSAPLVGKVRSELVAESAIAPTVQRIGKDGRAQASRKIKPVLVENIPSDNSLPEQIAPVETSLPEQIVPLETSLPEQSIPEYIADDIKKPVAIAISAILEAAKDLANSMTYDELVELEQYIANLLPEF